jgi:branched-subunit amino acid ABC-type transport system permease component
VTDLVPFIAVGIATGCIYGIAGLGVVLTYKTSGVFNFAQGAIAMGAAYCYYTLTVTYGSPPWLAMLFTVVVFGAVVGVALDKVLFRRLHGANPAAQVAASLGLLVFIRAVILLTYGGESRPVPDFLPTHTIGFGSVNFGANQLIIAGLALGVTVGLAFFFRSTRVGKAMRAVVDNRSSAELMGIDSGRVVTVGWIIGCSFAAFSGVLLVPSVGLDTLTVPVLVMHAFAAAVIAGLVNLPLAFIAAVVLGMGESLTTKFVANVHSLSGLSQSLPFLVMFVVLFLARGRLFAPPPAAMVGVRARRLSGWRPLSWRTGAVLAAVAALAPGFVSGSRLVTLTNALVFLTLFASLNLLVGLSRQVSLCHAAFAALGAVFFSHFSGTMPFPLAMALAGICVVPFGAAIAVSSIRLSGLFLALATFALGLALENLIYPMRYFFGVALSVQAERPGLIEGDNAFYYFALVVGIGAVALVGLVARSRIGRALVAAGDSPTGVESVGIDVQRVRVAIFCLSTWLAGVAGAIILLQFETITSTSYTFLTSLIWVVAVVAAGPSSASGLILGVVLFTVLPTLSSSGEVVLWMELGFGLGAIVLAQEPNGFDGLVRRLAGRARTAVEEAPVRRRAGAGALRPAPGALSRHAH